MGAGPLIACAIVVVVRFIAVGVTSPIMVAAGDAVSRLVEAMILNRNECSLSVAN